MTLRSYVWGLRMSTGVLWTAWLIIIAAIDPETSGLVGQLLFYLTFFFGFLGVYVLFFLWVWRRASGEQFSMAEVRGSFREGVLLAILTITFVLFQQFGIFIWWTALLVLAGILLIELYFLSFRRKNIPNESTN